MQWAINENLVNGDTALDEYFLSGKSTLDLVEIAAGRGQF